MSEGTKIDPPGWYPDNSRDGSERWWDGRGWTEYTRDPQAEALSGAVVAVRPAKPGKPSWKPGFYDDGHGARRWWNGQAWTAHVEPGSVDPAQAEMQRVILNETLTKYTAAGYTVESNDGTRAVVARRIPMSFVGNTIGVILTGGLWLIYILVRIGSPQYVRLTLTVDQNGVVHK